MRALRIAVIVAAALSLGVSARGPTMTKRLGAFKQPMITLFDLKQAGGDSERFSGGRAIHSAVALDPTQSAAFWSLLADPTTADPGPKPGGLRCVSLGFGVRVEEDGRSLDLVLVPRCTRLELTDNSGPEKRLNRDFTAALAALLARYLPTVDETDERIAGAMNAARP